MGWAFCGKDQRGREIGYGIVASCDQKGCNEIIDRGLGYCCGSMHNGDEGGCGRYFCEKHLGGWPGPRGGCIHRFKGAYGQAICQPMWNKLTGERWCACGLAHPMAWVIEEEGRA